MDDRLFFHSLQRTFVRGLPRDMEMMLGCLVIPSELKSAQCISIQIQGA